MKTGDAVSLKSTLLVVIFLCVPALLPVSTASAQTSTTGTIEGDGGRHNRGSGSRRHRDRNSPGRRQLLSDGQDSYTHVSIHCVRRFS